MEHRAAERVPARDLRQVRAVELPSGGDHRVHHQFVDGAVSATGAQRPATVAVGPRRRLHLGGEPDVFHLGNLSVDERRARAAELDALVAAWTAGQPPPVAAETLVALGVPAHAVQNSGECAADEQLAAQHHFVTVPHAEHGTVVVEASRITLSATPATIRRGPPVLGEHTVEVLTELLGYDDTRLGELFAADALD
jgi:CoA-transferase family III